MIMGLDTAGKTTILYQLKLGEVVTTIPTISFNVETVTYGKLNLTFWDVGGRDKTRPLRRLYLPNTKVLVYVVDSNDRDRLDQVYDELHSFLEVDELREVPLLVLANKQDLPNPLSVLEITDKLNLNKITDRPVHVQGCCATSGDGLYDGLDWIANGFKTAEESKTEVTEKYMWKGWEMFKKFVFT